MGLTDVDWALAKDFFSIIGTLVSAAAVAVAFYFGKQGLSTWQRQMKGTSDHQLARRALIELYRYREGMELARSPIMFSSEMELTEEERKNITFSEAKYLGKRKAYQARFDVLVKARSDIQVTLLEIEAIWGKSAKALFVPLFKLQQEFYIYVDTHLMATEPYLDKDARRSYRDEIDRRRNILFDNSDEVGDSFRQEFNAACLSIENYMKKRL